MRRGRFVRRRRFLQRRRRRLIRRTFRRIALGTTMLLLLGGSMRAIKLRTKDAEHIEQETGKSPEEMTEEELVATMKKLGIKKLEVTPADEAQAHRCPKCSALLKGDELFCANCGAEL